MPESNATFRAGSTSRVQGGTTHAAVKIIVHPKYNNGSNDYDYALVEVCQCVNDIINHRYFSNMLYFRLHHRFHWVLQALKKLI